MRARAARSPRPAGTAIVVLVARLLLLPFRLVGLMVRRSELQELRRKFKAIDDAYASQPEPDVPDRRNRGDPASQPWILN